MTNDKCHNNKDDHNWKPDCYCFTQNNLLITDRGLYPVWLLIEGDKLLTRDNGFQEIKSITEITYDLTERPELAPVRLGELVVSPNHRVLEANLKSLFGPNEEVLVAAKHLDEVGIGKVLDTTEEVTYYHIELENHELVYGDGYWSETLFVPDKHKVLCRPELKRHEVIAMYED